jgi:hypothetical protein
MFGVLRLLLVDIKDTHITFVFSFSDTEKQQETPSPIRKCNSSDEKSKNQNAGIHLSEK